MGQIHKRFTAGQVKVLLKGYCQGILDRPAIEETLGIGRPTFFLLLKGYRHNPDQFSLVYHRKTPAGTPASVEKEIETALMLEKGLIEDPSLPISGYNYSAIRDRLAKHDIKIALSTTSFCESQYVEGPYQAGCEQPHGAVRKYAFCFSRSFPIRTHNRLSKKSGGEVEGDSIDVKCYPIERCYVSI